MGNGVRLGRAYDDVLDPTRVMVPVSQRGGRVLCRVINEGQFIGTVEVAESLFRDENGHIGFRERNPED